MKNLKVKKLLITVKPSCMHRDRLCQKPKLERVVEMVDYVFLFSELMYVQFLLSI